MLFPSPSPGSHGGHGNSWKVSPARFSTPKNHTSVLRHVIHVNTVIIIIIVNIFDVVVIIVTVIVITQRRATTFTRTGCSCYHSRRCGEPSPSSLKKAGGAGAGADTGPLIATSDWRRAGCATPAFGRATGALTWWLGGWARTAWRSHEPGGCGRVPGGGICAVLATMIRVRARTAAETDSRDGGLLSDIHGGRYDLSNNGHSVRL